MSDIDHINSIEACLASTALLTDAKDNEEIKMQEIIGRLIGKNAEAHGAPRLTELPWHSVGFTQGEISPYTRRPTLYADQRGARLELSLPLGSWELLLTHHEWSGKVIIRDRTSANLINLYAPREQSGPLAVNVKSAGPHEPVTIEATGAQATDARGSQVWFLGARGIGSTFHPEAGEPVSETCRLLRGWHGNFLGLRTDTGISEHIASTGVWEKTSVAVFERYARDARLILDIGANIGHHSVVLSRLLGPGGRLFAFEPQMQMYNLLNANLVLNGCTNVEPHRIALGAAPQRLRMHPISYDSFANFGALGVQPGTDAATGSGEVIDVMCLDDFVDERGLNVEAIDFIKMDVQSFELFTLQGGLRTLKAARPVLFFEVSPFWMHRRGYDYRAIYDLITPLGYVFHNEDMTLHKIPAWDGESKAEWNVLALPQGSKHAA